MFSGIVEMIGTVSELTIVAGCKQLMIAPAHPLTDLSVGDSIAVNGVCLTVTECDNTSFKVTAVPETLKLTNLDMLTVNQAVNLEQSLQLGDRVGGHYIQGHIDSIGEIIDITFDASNAWLVKISVPEHLSKYLIAKGYVALDGMSITVINIFSDHFTITLIPHTQQASIAYQYQIGTKINIEVDMMGKYIENFIQKTISLE
ncbi:MAG: riboflavin synthase subunit alpha [Gammaproteobacteria bacterium RIFCSPHIGHO2_12_FULL_37_14]|nr:MAG: riboflavin synthase subunit alpha [Gammaproteobacteria bacterium RIFCSPHIGHO2_12_FULL_37_14]